MLSVQNSTFKVFFLFENWILIHIAWLKIDTLKVFSKTIIENYDHLYRLQHPLQKEAVEHAYKKYPGIFSLKVR